MESISWFCSCALVILDFLVGFFIAFRHLLFHAMLLFGISSMMEFVSTFFFPFAPCLFQLKL